MVAVQLQLLEEQEIHLLLVLLKEIMVEQQVQDPLDMVVAVVVELLQ